MTLKVTTRTMAVTGPKSPEAARDKGKKDRCPRRHLRESSTLPEMIIKVRKVLTLIN